jgi:hypothetical protein
MSDRIDRSTVPKQRLEVRVRKQRDRTLIALADDARELDPVATFIWQQMDGERSIGEIVTEVCAAYDVDEATALGDIAELTQDLVDAGFLNLAVSRQ